MATRPIFIPSNNDPGAETKEIEFQWYPGMSISQKQKSIKSLHEAARNIGYCPVLEISSKSLEQIGSDLSAFNLFITTKFTNKKFSVESAFQSSKVFEKGGPYIDLLNVTSREAKKDKRLILSGNLIKFSFYNKDFPIQPRTYFYDWLYINALNQNQQLSKELVKYQAFSDIEFNPKKSINCQAFSAAMYVSLVNFNKLEDALKSPTDFLNIFKNCYRKKDSQISVQRKLF